MLNTMLLLTILWAVCSAEFYYPNVSRSTLSGVAAYRSALTLDWLMAEDIRQRELALAYETEATPPMPMLASDCVNYEKPASGKVARLMLELLKNLEGDEGTLVPEMIQALVRSKLLVETSMLEAEPDLESLVKTPGVMMGEPHATFPRILAMVWIAVTDTMTTKKNGWCPLHKVTKYLTMTRPTQIAKHTRTLDPVIARARFIMEEFIRHITPNKYEERRYFDTAKANTAALGRQIGRRQNEKVFRSPLTSNKKGRVPATIALWKAPRERDSTCKSILSTSESDLQDFLQHAESLEDQFISSAGFPKIATFLVFFVIVL